MGGLSATWIERGRAAARFLGAALLAYAFVLVLMNASAQSDVALALAKNSADYSAVYEKMVQDEKTDVQIAAEQDRDAKYGAYLEAVAPLRALSQRLAGAGLCDLDQKAADISPVDVSFILQVRVQCVESSPVAAGFAATATKIEQGRQDIEAKASAWLAEENTAQSASREVVSITAQVNGAVAQARTVDPALSDRLATLKIVRENRALGSGFLLELPPSLMHIVLAFMSGLFGGLLVTLVLVVYPNSGLDLTTPGGGYGARIMLGGLIAVSVFIVLGSGAAVLGTASAFSDGSANYLAFSGIGVLAGMFSDRAARWLSQNADVFFQRADNGGSPSPDPSAKPAEEETKAD